ncbi:protein NONRESPONDING TO OXYLIPINS 2, mitochondrial isoform X1 [Rhododendron vialii]|uniref:protein NONRESPONDING TO OXYLIPINS 2, mitochondrial isoform X1 n=1 Tax=Rhododendron vialii TaxID=182163 RepID=UPI00265EF9F5|nr:protein NONRESPONDING TO OXYLIPINS 2, mitochondrial isoform X1 [Rhododendron vialii]
MASRFRSISRPTLNLLKSTITTSASAPKPKSMPCLRAPLSSPTLPRSISQLGSLQSLLPLHTAISSARLTSCLGADSKGSRSLSQGMICSANPGV